MTDDPDLLCCEACSKFFDVDHMQYGVIHEGWCCEECAVEIAARIAACDHVVKPYILDCDDGFVCEKCMAFFVELPDGAQIKQEANNEQ